MYRFAFLFGWFVRIRGVAIQRKSAVGSRWGASFFHSVASCGARYVELFLIFMYYVCWNLFVGIFSHNYIVTLSVPRVTLFV